MEVIKETALTIFTDQVGTKFLQVLQDEVYGSGTFQLIIFLATVFTLVGVGFSLHQGRLPQKLVSFALALGLSAPWNGAPVGFALVNAGSNLFSSILERATLKFSSDTGDAKTATNMHPGLVMEMISAAATTKVDDLTARHKLQKFISKCFAGTLRKDGQKASFDDLFDFKARYHTGGVRIDTSFVENVLDERSLINNTAYFEVESGINCHTALNRVRKAFIYHLEGKAFTTTERVIRSPSGASEDRIITTEKWYKNWQNQNSPFLNVARNLRLSVASQYEKSRLINESSSWDNSYYGSTGMNASLREFMLGLDSGVMEAGFAVTNLSDLPARITGNRWAASLGGAIKDLKEKLEMMPYYLVVVKNILRLVAVIAVISVFSGKFQIFSIWAGSWFVVTILPSIISAVRTQHNSIILAKLGIQDLLAGGGEGNKALAFGVDIEQAEALLDEFVPMAYTMINQELTLIGFLAAAVLAGSWLGGMMGNGMVGWLSNSVQGQLLGQATHTATAAASTAAASTIGRVAAPVAGALGGASGKAAHFVKEGLSTSRNSNLPHPSGDTGYSLKSIFPKEKS